jgi:hypothetical protein
MHEHEPRRDTIDNLPPKIREVFEQTGYGCLAAETDQGVVHVCHAADRDIAGFSDKPICYQWQLLILPTAPLLRLEITILDQPLNPYRFESFLNVDQEDQARILAELANQDHLSLAFHGDDLAYRYTRALTHGEQQWQYLDELAMAATNHLQAIPEGQRDFDLAKATFIRGSSL